jgi:dethiobiotin synthetase
VKKTIFSTIVMAAAALAGAIASVFRPLGEMLNDAAEGHMARNGLMLHAITATTKNSVNANRFTYAHLDDAAVPAAILQYPGFKPTRVTVINVTDRITYEWFEGMNEGDYLKTVAAGTRTLETDDVLVVERDTGARPSITLVAAATLQNKRYFIEAVA